MSALLFGRFCSVKIGSFLADGLRCAFKVTKTIKPEPNKCELSVWNISPESMGLIVGFGVQSAALAGQKEIILPIQITAGYEASNSIVFLGDVRSMRQEPDGEDPSVVTVFGAGDGESAYKSARVNVSMAKGAKIDTVLRNLVAALGVAPGNVNAAILKIKQSGIANVFFQGTVLQGSAAREMTAVCRSAGQTWSIQNGALQIIPLGKALEGTAIKLTPDTGLVGSPSLDSKGKLSCTALMQGDIFPGRKIVVESRFVSGGFLVESTTHTGDTHGDDWSVSIEGKRI